MTKAFSKPTFLDASATATPAFDPPTSAISSTASLTSLQLGQEHYNCITHPGESVFSGPRPSVINLVGMSRKNMWREEHRVRDSRRPLLY